MAPLGYEATRLFFGGLRASKRETMTSGARAIAGYPEWSPDQQALEAEIKRVLREVFALHGFPEVNSRCQEPIANLVSEGDDKEIMTVGRLGSADEAEMAMRFDLTVPFARYVAQNVESLPLPFARYAIGTAWRGERPQFGRYREFTQADFDVVARTTLPLSFDGQIVALLLEATAKLPIPPVLVSVNNRKILQGAYASLEIGDVTATLRVVDKLRKIGRQGVIDTLVDQGLEQAVASTCVDLAEIKGHPQHVVKELAGLNLRSDLLDEGLHELVTMFESIPNELQGQLICNLEIARGLAYYTGLVVEGYFQHDTTGFGAVCSGGRYENLVGKFDPSLKMPGVGASIGVTRIMGYLTQSGGGAMSRSNPAVVLIALESEELRGRATEVAQQLRNRGIAAMVSPDSPKWGDQIGNATKRGIPHVVFVKSDGLEVRDLSTRTQEQLDPASWSPGADAQPRPIDDH